MASEDNFLRLDKNNFDSEILYHLFNDDIDMDDLKDFLKDGFITSKQYQDYMDIVTDTLIYTNRRIKWQDMTIGF